jgi:4-amino-4-deoxy-L-arabinose transferase-like glycosyltransferase
MSVPAAPRSTLDYGVTPSRAEAVQQWLMRRAPLLVLLFAIAGFVARTAAIFVLHRWTIPNDIEHRQLALSLLEHGALYFRDFNYYGPSSVQSPPYPILLAALFKIFGPVSKEAFIAAMIINAIAGALTVWLSYRLVLAIGGSVLTGLLTAAMVAVWPSQVYASTHVQAIALITLCTVAMIYLYQRAVTTGRVGAWIGYSIVATLGALTEPVLLPVTALSGVLILLQKRLTIEARIRNAAILLAAAMLIVMPWMVRNHTVHGKWVPVKSTFWVNVWKGNNDHATGTDRVAMSQEAEAKLEAQQAALSDTHMIDRRFDSLHQYDRLTPQQRARLEKQPEIVREEVFKEFATSWISHHKLRYTKLCVVRIWKTVWVEWDNPKTHSVFYWLPRTMMLALMIPGIWIALRQRWAMLFMGLVASSCLTTYALTIAAARFSLPLEPLALMFVAATIAWLMGERQANAEV